MKEAPSQGPEHGEGWRTWAEVEREHDIEKQNSGPGTQSSDNAGVKEGALDDLNGLLIILGPDDVENPLNWSTKSKWAVTAAAPGTSFLHIIISMARASYAIFKKAYYQHYDHISKA
jgi:hypothetical protein